MTQLLVHVDRSVFVLNYNI